MVEPGAIAIRWSRESPSTPPAGTQPLSDPASAATLLQWYVRSGDEIHKGQDLLLIGEGPALHPVTSPVNGTLLVQWSEVGEIMGAGQTIGWIRPDLPDAKSS